MNDFGVHRSFLMPIFEVPINLAMGVQYRYGEFDITTDDACFVLPHRPTGVCRA